MKCLLNYYPAIIGMTNVGIIGCINSRTLQFDKEWEHIKYEHFIKGVPASKKGFVAHTGLGISKSTLRKGLRVVEEYNLIESIDTQGTEFHWYGDMYKINYEELTKHYEQWL